MYLILSSILTQLAETVCHLGDSMTSTHIDLFARLVDRASGAEPPPAGENYRIPVSAYTDPRRHQQEWQALFQRKPLALAHESQIPEPGDAIVHDWLGMPLVTVRDKTGAIGTFMNVCRHRGMRLVSDPGQTQLRSFVCPYHQWTYGLDGRLRNIPLEESFENLDHKALGLIALPTEVRHGLVWVQATPGQAMDLDGHLAGLGADLDAFAIPDFRYFRQHERRIACNWKLVQDAFLDGYHVVRLHKNTVGSFFPDCLAVSDRVGEHVRSAVGRNEIMEATRLGREQWDMRHHATFSYSLFPNSVIIMHPDYTSLIHLYPTAVDETIFVHTMLVPELPKDEKGQAHYDRSFELIDQGVFQAEDIAVCVGAQSGMHTGANDALLCGAQELSLRMFHQAVEENL